MSDNTGATQPAPGAADPHPSLVRIWGGATTARDADAYLAYLERTGFAEYRATPGNRGVLALRRIVDGRAELLLLSAWESEAAIRAFAGQDMDQAVFYPEDDRFLVARDETVRHYDVVYEAGWDRAIRGLHRAPVTTIAPQIYRKRLLIEGFFTREVTHELLEAYFRHVTEGLALRPYGAPIIHRTSAEGREVNEGYDGFIPLVDSGIYIGAWLKPRFVSTILYTCAPFDEEAAVRLVRDFFGLTEYQASIF